MDENASRAGAANPAALFQMITGYWASQSIYVAAKLGVADLLADGSRSIEEIAAATQTDAPSLRRVLRALASIGVFSEVRPGRFALTPQAALLQTDRPDSMRALAIMHSEEQFRTWGDVLYSVQNGKTAFEQLYGMSYFDYLANHPESDRIFNEAMSGITAQVARAVIESYDFAAYPTIVDVAGSYGKLLVSILHRYPEARGILFDQPHVVADAEEHLRAAGMAERCTTVGGDFFAEIPAGADAYLLAQILHDWNDEDCISILRQCRRAIPAHGKLLVIELVIPAGEEPALGKWMDLHMLVLLGGRDRTAAEYDALFQAAGFKLARVIPTNSPTSIVEAVPV